MVRIIHSERGIEEAIYITEDIKADQDDFIRDGWNVVSDKTYDIDLPSSFPSENEFIKFGS